MVVISVPVKPLWRLTIAHSSSRSLAPQVFLCSLQAQSRPSFGLIQFTSILLRSSIGAQIPPLAGLDASTEEVQNKPFHLLLQRSLK